MLMTMLLMIAVGGCGGGGACCEVQRLWQIWDGATSVYSSCPATLLIYKNTAATALWISQRRAANKPRSPNDILCNNGNEATGHLQDSALHDNASTM